MNEHELHTLLTGQLGLVPQPVGNHVSRTYFYQRVEWHPSRSTRVLRVLYGEPGEVSRIQLCVSSDNNNTALIAPPFDARLLTKLVSSELDMLKERLCTAD
jgi:hypothetical protein